MEDAIRLLSLIIIYIVINNKNKHWKRAGPTPLLFFSLHNVRNNKLLAFAILIIIRRNVKVNKNRSTRFAKVQFLFFLKSSIL